MPQQRHLCITGLLNQLYDHSVGCRFWCCRIVLYFVKVIFIITQVELWHGEDERKYLSSLSSICCVNTFSALKYRQKWIIGVFKLCKANLLFIFFVLLQSKVWNAPERLGKEIWAAPRSLSQLTAGVSESSGPGCWQSVTNWSSSYTHTCT